ncbi:hypothetical protein ASE61_20400 [Bosea sp. Root670]|nr:hypothetical protein ASE61_20400 [Bosea sp. Root670]
MDRPEEMLTSAPPEPRLAVDMRGIASRMQVMAPKRFTSKTCRIVASGTSTKRSRMPTRPAQFTSPFRQPSSASQRANMVATAAASATSASIACA